MNRVVFTMRLPRYGGDEMAENRNGCSDLTVDIGTAIADPGNRDENSKKNGGLLVKIFGRFTFRPLLMLNRVNPMKQNQHIFSINCNKFFFLGQFVAAF